LAPEADVPPIREHFLTTLANRNPETTINDAVAVSVRRGSLDVVLA
jgi:hypothetical protein